MNKELHHNPWVVLDEHIAYENQWIKVIHHEVLNPSGNKGVYGQVHFKNIAIAIIPVDKDMNTFLVGQYRFPIESYSWEVPEGGCPFEEIPLVAAKRELLEETGLVAQHWELLANAHLSNSVSDEHSYIYLASGLSQQTAMPEETEQLLVKKLPLIEAFNMVYEGIITDSLSVIALQRVELLLLKGLLKLT